MGLGTGNDGGVVATSRKFLVSLKKREEKVDSSEQCAIKWHMCALTAAPLSGTVRGQPPSPAFRCCHTFA